MSLTPRQLDTLLNWNWAHEPRPQRLSAFNAAPGMIGVYELGFMDGETFVPQYVGRAIGMSLRERLGTHFQGSHNRRIAANAHLLWFRCKPLGSPALASYVEAVSIAALDYPFNRRNEWQQHWALES